jgi:hypothetical protein
LPGQTLNKKQLTRTRGLRKQRNADPLDDLKREIAVMKKLKHPNLVKLYEVTLPPLKQTRAARLLPRLAAHHVDAGLTCKYPDVKRAMIDNTQNESKC